MNANKLAWTALVISVVAIGLEVQSRILFKHRVLQEVEARENAYCKQLITKMNRGRELMNLPPTSATNFADVLQSYFESMAAVMEQGVTNAANQKK